MPDKLQFNVRHISADFSIADLDNLAHGFVADAEEHERGVER